MAGPDANTLLARLENLLTRVRHAEAAPVGLSDYIEVRLLLERQPHLAEIAERRKLRFALASLLSRNKAEWDRVWQISSSLEGETEAELQQDVVHGAMRRVESPAAKPLSTRMIAALLLAAVLVAILLPAIVSHLRQPAGQHVTAPPAKADLPQSSRLADVQWIRYPINDAATFKEPPKSVRVIYSNAEYLAGGGGALAVVLGLSWLILPAGLAMHRRKEAQALRDVGARQRAELSRAAEANSVSRRLDYSFAGVDPLKFEAVVDSATILARLFGSVATRELDVERTIAATIDQGGRFNPIRAHSRLCRHLVVLVDNEKGAHPWLDDIDWLLAQWINLGVDIRRYNFDCDPFFLNSPGASTTTIEAVARLSEGESLLLVSRKVSIRDMTGRPSRWLRHVDAWPVRALLDPAPIPTGRLPKSYRSDMGRLTRRGFPRYLLTEAGIRGLATHLAGNSLPADQSHPPLAPLDPSRAAAVRLWALSAAMVPDPSWAQLQAIRAATPEIASALPDNRDLQLLIDWVERVNHGASSEAGDGRTLSLSRERADTLIAAYRLSEQKLAPQLRSEGRFRRMLLDQLAENRPQDPLMAGFWQLKCAEHLFGLAPERALPLIDGLLGGAWHEEAHETLQDVLRREAHAPTLPRSIRDALRLALDERGQLVPFARPFRQNPVKLLLGTGLLGFAAFSLAQFGSAWMKPASELTIGLPRDVRIFWQQPAVTPEDQPPPLSTRAAVASPSQPGVPPPPGPPPLQLDRTEANIQAYSALQGSYCENGQVCALDSRAINGIREALLSHFDSDRSGLLDSEAELSSIDCVTLNALFQAVESYGRRIVPGEISEGYMQQFGFAESLNKLLLVRRPQCLREAPPVTTT